VSSIRPGRAGDLPDIVELWRADVLAGRRDSMPRRSYWDVLGERFDFEARSRVYVDARGEPAAAVLASGYPSPDGTLAQLDIVGPADGAVTEALASWGAGLSRASGAIAVLVWVGRGHGKSLAAAGLKLSRPWWRMDRTLLGQLPAPEPVEGYVLADGHRVAKSVWADMHNRSFADHWRFSYRTEEELVGGASPELCLMATTVSGEPAAITLNQLEHIEPDTRPQPLGLVRSVGTVPEHRRRGLATWLVAESLVRLRDAGARHASLYVDGRNATRAFDAYRKLGFEVAFEAEVWEATFP
jgi:ribosomal protein S18 acetylase RimI-like enzyme